MKHDFYVALFLGCFMAVSYTVHAAEEFDLTPEEEGSVTSAIRKYNIPLSAASDETCLLTEQMVGEMSVPAIKKMLACNEAWLKDEAKNASPEEIARLQEEVRIFRKVLGQSGQARQQEGISTPDWNSWFETF